MGSNYELKLAAYNIAKAILSGDISPYRGASKIWGMSAEVKYQDLAEIEGFGGLASQWDEYPDQRDLLEADIRAKAERFVRRFGQGVEAEEGRQ
jgi:hypothetical protein